MADKFCVLTEKLILHLKVTGQKDIFNVF